MTQDNMGNKVELYFHKTKNKIDVTLLSVKSGGGVVYTQWGHYSCPHYTGACLLYTGRPAGPYYKHKGGGSNPQCLPLYPTYFKYQSGS